MRSPIRLAVNQPQDLTAKLEMALGLVVAAAQRSTISGTHLVHALSYPLGG
ncbi:alcohol dehydrogenase, partial [Klebsiella pneumoniae]